MLFVARSRVVQEALQLYLLEKGEDNSIFAQCTVAQAVHGGKQWLRKVFVEGVSILVEGSCDRRLETSHWVMGMLWEDREESNGMEMVEWFFEEARQQVLEMEEDDAKEVARMFGSQ